MNCMKCGREIALGQVFCKDCLADMESHPVRPDTPISLPRHDEPVTRRAPAQKKTRTPEEQVKRLRKAVALLSIALVILSTVSILAAFWLLKQHAPAVDPTLPGQNYSTMEET